MKLYLDTSAALKLVVEESESTTLVDTLKSLDPDDRLVSSWLLHTELHCAAARRSAVISASVVDGALDVIDLIDIVRADLLEAPTIASGLRSQDALHLAVAVRAGCDSIVTYDAEQAAAARTLGLQVLQPT